MRARAHAHAQPRARVRAHVRKGGGRAPASGRLAGPRCERHLHAHVRATAGRLDAPAREHLPGRRRAGARNKKRRRALVPPPARRGRVCMAAPHCHGVAGAPAWLTGMAHRLTARLGAQGAWRACACAARSSPPAPPPNAPSSAARCSTSRRSVRICARPHRVWPSVAECGIGPRRHTWPPSPSFLSQLHASARIRGSLSLPFRGAAFFSFFQHRATFRARSASQAEAAPPAAAHCARRLVSAARRERRRGAGRQQRALRPREQLDRPRPRRQHGAAPSSPRAPRACRSPRAPQRPCACSSAPPPAPPPRARCPRGTTPSGRPAVCSRTRPGPDAARLRVLAAVLLAAVRQGEGWETARNPARPAVLQARAGQLQASKRARRHAAAARARDCHASAHTDRAAARARVRVRMRPRVTHAHGGLFLCAAVASEHGGLGTAAALRQGPPRCRLPSATSPRAVVSRGPRWGRACVFQFLVTGPSTIGCSHSLYGPRHLNAHVRACRATWQSSRWTPTISRGSECHAAPAMAQWRTHPVCTFPG